MEYVIVMDSCGECTAKMKEDERVISAPLTLQADDHIIIDDDTFDQADFLRKVAESPNCPKSACPSPDYYKEAFEKAEKRAYGVTLTAELSGSYNSAMLARDLVLEERPELQIHIFNSRSASVGETLITEKIQECEEKGMEFSEVVETVENYINTQNTYFVLENLETLRKNGRLSNLKAFVADRFYPSSKLCSCCGNIKKDLKLSDRIYRCECGNIIDRDFQASINLKAYGERFAS